MLNGKEIAEFVKDRQAKQVRNLKQSLGLHPSLAIIRTNPDKIVDSYMRLKQNYGNDIGVEVIVHTVEQSDAIDAIIKLNKDKKVNGIIVQIPLPDKSQTDEILNSVKPSKDVDALGEKAIYDPATPMAINWLLAGYNIDLRSKNIVIVGRGRLVGKPLAEMWLASGLNVKTVDSSIKNISQIIKEANILVCATGVPGLITKEMVKDDAVIVDAGVATDSNGLVGDISAEVRQLPNITITPEKGGVGPLTVCALFENLLRSAKHQAKKTKC